MTTFDANLNRRISGGEKFVISLGLLSQGTFSDYRNGTYQAGGLLRTCDVVFRHLSPRPVSKHERSPTI
jgi:hypothetical protein